MCKTSTLLLNFSSRMPSRKSLWIALMWRGQCVFEGNGPNQQQDGQEEKVQVQEIQM